MAVLTINNDQAAELWQCNNDIVLLESRLDRLYTDILAKNPGLTLADLFELGLSMKAVTETLRLVKQLMDTIEEKGS